MHEKVTEENFNFWYAEAKEKNLGGGRGAIAPPPHPM
jgi:hypothetical protein